MTLTGPDFIIIGAQIAGTTALYRTLVAQPAIHDRGPPREVHYFGREFAQRPEQFIPLNSLDEYLRLFSVPNGKLCGEKTPEYMLRPGLSRIVHKACPNSRIIAILRNPTDRLEAHIRKLRTQKRFSKQPMPVEAYTSRDTNFCVTRGYYPRQLQDWLSTWKKQLFILFYENFCKNPDACLDAIAKHLEISKLKPIEDPPKPKPALMTPNQRAFWDDHYRQENIALERLLQRSLPSSWAR